jgi:ATP-dependent RNA circularization protein (DNA/RNA ligase family)
MKEYHKIQTVYFRDPENNHKTLLEGNWAKPEFELLKDIDWIGTEKIDGTNIRIMCDGKNVRFGGKTDNAQIPSILIEVLQDTFTNELMKECFPDADNVCLYGEGYGKKIQKGGNYLPDRADFILFDVKIGDWWLTRETNEDIAKKLNIGVVPIIGIWKLEQAIEYVKNGFKSTISHNKDYMAEGLIMKPKIELFNRKGERIITKIKYKDFKR